MNMMTLYDNNNNEISNVNLSEETKITLPTTCLKINDKLLPSLPGLQRQLSIPNDDVPLTKRSISVDDDEQKGGDPDPFHRRGKKGRRKHYILPAITKNNMQYNNNKKIQNNTTTVSSAKQDKILFLKDI